MRIATSTSSSVFYPVNLLVWASLFQGRVVAQTNNSFTHPEVNVEHRHFADNLTAELYFDPANELTSSWSISLALALLYPAAIDPSYGEMQSALHLPDISSNSSSKEKLVWNETTTRLQTAYNGDCTGSETTQDENGQEVEMCYQMNPHLVVAYKIYVSNQMSLEPDYAAIVQDYAEALDFLSQDAGSIINAWVNETTLGKIPTIVKEGPQDDMDSAILSAIYLKALWANEFSTDFTSVGAFYSSPTKDSVTTAGEAQFMHDVRYNQMYSDSAVPEYQLLQLFLGGSLSVIFALPFNTTTELVSSSNVLEALDSLEPTRVAMAIPKFQFTSQYQDDLQRALASLNLEEPFSPSCDSLCVFEGTQCTAYVTKIIHKTFIDLNEKGVEAAAVTLAGLAGTSLPPDDVPVLFVADHPFQFFIYDSQEDLVLFEGKVADPTVAENALPPTLQKSHNDTDFWESLFSVTPKVSLVEPEDLETSELDSSA